MDPKEVAQLIKEKGGKAVYAELAKQLGPEKAQKIMEEAIAVIKQEGGGGGGQQGGGQQQAPAQGGQEEKALSAEEAVQMLDQLGVSAEQILGMIEVFLNMSGESLSQLQQMLVQAVKGQGQQQQGAPAQGEPAPQGEPGGMV